MNMHTLPHWQLYSKFLNKEKEKIKLIKFKEYVNSPLRRFRASWIESCCNCGTITSSATPDAISATPWNNTQFS